MKLAIDIGFSSIKVAGAYGLTLKFPTAIAAYNKPQVEFGESSKKPVFFNGRYYLVGDDAIGEQDVKYSLEIDFLIEYSPLFIYKAIEMVENGAYGYGQNRINEISLGLPIEYYRSKMFDLWKKAEKFEVNKRTFSFFSEIKDGKVRCIHPQGGGILVDYIARNNINPEYSKEKGFVLDIGFNTVIVVAFDEGYTGVSENSKQYSKLGISRIAEDLSQKIAREYGIDDETKIETAEILLKKSIKNYGKTIDLSGYIAEAMSNYMESIMLRLQSDYERKLRQSDKLIIAGGGAYYIKNNLPERYKDMSFVIDLPEFSNARGFYLL
jgi:hypothetical protein